MPHAALGLAGVRLRRLAQRVAVLDAGDQLAAADGVEQAGERRGVWVDVLGIEADIALGGRWTGRVQERRHGGYIGATVFDRCQRFGGGGSTDQVDGGIDP